MTNSEKKFFWEIVPGETCNLRCGSCYAAENARPDHRILRGKELIRAENIAIDIGMTSLEILGGEPLLHPDIDNFVANFKKRVPSGFCGIVSNGILITEKKTKSLKESGLDQLTVSIDGTTAEINDKNRGLGSFEKAIRGANFAMEAGIGTTLAYTINPYNIKDTANIFPFASRIGFEAIGLQILEMTGRAKNTFKNETNFNRITGLNAMATAYNFSRKNIYSEVNTRNKYKTLINRFYNAGLELPKIRCDGGRETFMLSSGGDFFPCSQYAYGPSGETRNQGVNLSTKNIDSIDLFQKKYLEFNSSMSLLENINFSTCQACGHRESCAPCPLINPKGQIPECEWVDSKTNELNNLVRSSRVSLNLEPEELSLNRISFKVATQEQALSVPMSRESFQKIIDLGEVKQMEDLTQSDMVEFLCKLRSHRVISLSNFPYSS